ncbi:MAG: GNAT family N-acetyltransferase [Lachnospiraceae bacterium]|nr:GNAT family N-acetyltransferase [Lachnospiraceae bacterium]
MRELHFEERNKLASFFQNPTSGIVKAAFYQNIGKAWIKEEENKPCGILLIGNTCYYGGHCVEENAAEFIMEQFIKERMAIGDIIPQDCSALPYFDEFFRSQKDAYPCSMKKTERHLMDIDLDRLDHSRLRTFLNEIPPNYELQPISHLLFDRAREDQYLNNFIRLFPDYKDFGKNGFGFFLLEGKEIVAGISSYARYKDGVEVQIAVSPKHRGKHLASSLGAAFLLECQKRKLYPWWDCANPTSEHIATELGYVLKQVTPIYRCMFTLS